MQDIIEEWRPFHGFEGFYEVSSLGRVKRLRTEYSVGSGGVRICKERIMKLRFSNNIVCICLTSNGVAKVCGVARAVAIAFLGLNPNDFIRPMYRDGDKKNVTASNIDVPTLENKDEKIRQLIMDNSVPEPNSGCWLWTGTLSGGDELRGYGVFDFMKKSYKAHRASYEVFNGTIPEGLLIRHDCDQRTCVNPQHLSVGTKKDNADDMVRRGRWMGVRKDFNNVSGENSYNAKFNESQVREIRSLRDSGMKGVDVAKMFNTTPVQVCKLYKRTRWKHLV